MDHPSGMSKRACPACGEVRQRPLFSVAPEQFCAINSTYIASPWEVLGIPKELPFPIVECCKCRFVFTELLPPPQFLDLVYETVIDPRLGFQASCSPDWVSHQLDLGRRLLKALGESFPKEHTLKVLDFGCGFGTLVHALSGPRVECLGFETSESRLAHLVANGIDAVSRVEDVRTRGPYHAVVLSDVLEHVPEPRDTLSLCRELLVDNGLLLVNVPVFGPSRLQEVARAVQRNELSETEVNPWEHLNYFSTATLRRMLTDCGFVVEESLDPVDIGLRPGLRGVRKWGNAAKSMWRLGKSLSGWEPERPDMCARKPAPI